MAKKYLSFLIFLAILPAGCSKRPKDILNEDKMVAVMTDLQIAEAYERSGDANGYLQGKSREMLGRGILMQHGVTTEEMDSTLAWYGRNMDEYPKLYKKIDAELNRRQLKYARAAGESDIEGSSADLWPYSRHYVIDDRSLTDGIVATIPVNDLNPGEKLTWKMTVEGATAKDITVGVDYTDGSAEVYKQTNRSFDKWVEVSLQTDTLREVSSIFTLARFESTNPRVFVDSVQLLHIQINKEDNHKNGFQRSIPPAGRKMVFPSDTSTNSSFVPEAMTSRPSLSTENNLGVSTRR